MVGPPGLEPGTKGFRIAKAELTGVWDARS